MNSEYKGYTETNITSKKVLDESLGEKVFLGYVDKITDKLVHGWVCNSKDFNETLWVEVYADNVKIGRCSNWQAKSFWLARN